jgi:branched-chain amino acid transport system permease protein
MARPAGIFDVRYKQDIAIVRTRPQWITLGLFIALLFVIPLLFPSRFYLNVINTILIMVIAIHGLNILTGYAGQISVGHAAFMGVGAYACASFMTILGMNFFITLPLSALTAGVVGVIFGLPSLRLKGFYLAMGTIAAQFIITAFFLHFRPDIFRGAAGMSIKPVQLGSIVFDTQQSLYYLIMPITVVMTYFAQNLARSSMGRAFVAIRDNDLAAEIMGVNLFGYKMRAFFIGCFFAGVAGALNIAFRWTVRPDQYSLMDSIWMLGIIIIGGMGSILGGVLGTVFIKVLDELVSALTPFLGRVLPSELASRVGAATGLVVFGLVVVLFLILEPRGLAHRWEILKGRFRNWPFTYGH